MLRCMQRFGHVRMEKSIEMYNADTTNKIKVVNNTSESDAIVPEAPNPAPEELIEEMETQETKSIIPAPIPPTPPEELVENIETQATSSIIRTSISSPLPEISSFVHTHRPVVTRTHKISKQDTERVAALQERCRQICLSIFLRSHSPIRSLGITSSISGEGKSFLTTVLANVLAKDSSDPVILLECNWEHPSCHEYFGIPSRPGLAEWLRGECSEIAIRYQLDHNLVVIPAGNGRQDAVRLLKHIQQKGLLKLLSHSNELLVVDLPPVVTSAYGALAASLVESLLIVVRAGVTTNPMVAETYEQLKDLPVYGLVLNQVASRIPHWIRQLL